MSKKKIQSWAEFKAEVSRGIDGGMQDGFKAKIIRQGELHDAVQELSLRAGVKAPVIFLSDSRIPNAGIMDLWNKPRLLTTTGFMRAMGVAGEHGVNSEVRAAIGHELGHLKYGGSGLSNALQTRFLPVFGLPLAAVMARHIWLKSQTGSDNPSWPYTEEETRLSGINVDRVRSIATDMALAGGGFVGGNYLARYLSNQAEFQADRFGAQMESPQAMISALEKLERVHTKDFRNSIPANDPMRKLFMKEKPTNWWEALKQWTAGNMMAHPSTKERVQALEEMMREPANAIPQAKTMTAAIVGHISHQGKLLETAQHALSTASRIHI